MAIEGSWRAKSYYSNDMEYIVGLVGKEIARLEGLPGHYSELIMFWRPDHGLTL